MNYYSKRSGFTLAETLITIGIIGVVSALTIPNVINKYRAKTFETLFKKSYSNISQAYEKTKSDLGVFNLSEIYTVYQQGKGYYLASEFINAFDKNLRVVKIINTYTPITNYNGTKTVTSNAGNNFPSCNKILYDGSSYGTLINASKINVFVDINGPYKGPNRYGHDVFKFVITRGGNKIEPVKESKQYTEEELKNIPSPDIAGQPCNLTSNQGGNGFGCSWYAVNNICPYDNTKKYWDCLPK